MNRTTRNSGSLNLTSKLMILLLALFPVVPMPIAGGVPIQIALLGCIISLLVVRKGSLFLNKSISIYLLLAILLLGWEAITATYHASDKDFQYVLGRGLWLTMSTIVAFAFGPWVRKGRLDVVSKILSIGLLILLVAMTIESVFFPAREVGRQLGTINIPFPRATGVPNSDGKIGTFLVICFAYYLFVRPDLSVVQRILLQFGPILGLLFTQSRSTLLALAVTFGIYWVAKTLAKHHLRQAVFRLLVISLALGAFYTYQDIIISSLVGEGIYQKNVYARASHFHYGLREFSDNPIFGAGANSIREFDDKSGIHNTVMAMSVKSGIVGGLLISCIILFPAWIFRKRRGIAPYAFACSAGVFTEHMLYPGFINEFLIFSLLVPITVYNSDFFQQKIRNA